MYVFVYFFPSSFIVKGAVLGGSGGASATLLFCPPRGFFKYIMVLIVLIFPEILLPAVVHLCYLDQFGALVFNKILDIYDYLLLILYLCQIHKGTLLIYYILCT